METIKPEPNDLLDRDIKLEIEKMIESSKKIIDICDRISQEFFELESNEAVLKKKKILAKLQDKRIRCQRFLEKD